MTLDCGFVILIASSLSFLGLGVQPPTPDLGSMVAEGANYLPDSWWLSVFPGAAILLAVFGSTSSATRCATCWGPTSERPDPRHRQPQLSFRSHRGLSEVLHGIS